MNNFFKSIALCFSGGGYRAACFSFGVLSLFEKVNLLEKVKAISTVSGGTITGVKYAQSQVEKNSFDTFFKEYYNFLKENKLAENAISHIKGTKIWNKEENKHKRRNPINAFAIEYNKFTNDKTLGQVQDSISKKETHLERVVFNATDFTTGTPFRFQNIEGSRYSFGNKSAHKYKDLIDKVKLGDILASSSAFPGGFEPISFPNDFVPNQNEPEEIGLMDGGILDNQGTSAFIKNDAEKNTHDLIFVCDVASPYMEPFKFADRNKLTKILGFLSSFPVLLLTIILAAYLFKYGSIVLYTLSIVLLTVMVALQVIFYLASKALKKATGINQNLFIPPRRFGLYMIDRAKSLLKMAGEVFLKNDRRQNASNIYENYWKNTTTAAIYELRCEKDGVDINKPENSKEWDKIKAHTGDIPKKLKNAARTSTNFGTTLWFSDYDIKNNTLDAVIASGEFTACYNLIAHLVRHYSEEIKDEKTELGKLFIILIGLWEKFKKDPSYLVNERKLKLKL